MTISYAGVDKLMQGDCLELLPTLAAGSVDAVVTDPPFGQSNEKYDKGVEKAVWRECFRVAATNAALLCFTGNPTYHRIASDIEAAGWRVRQMWGWVYTDGLITSAWPKEGFDRLAPAMTPICFATKGKVLLHLEREGEPWQCWCPRSVTQHSDRASAKAAESGQGHWPRSLVCTDGLEGFQFFRLANGSLTQQKRTGHPNQKPMPLMRWLLAKLPPGVVVLDPFAGSGTTALACIHEGHRFIGMERDAAYFQIAVERIAAAQQEQQDAMPLFREEALPKP